MESSLTVHGIRWVIFYDRAARSWVARPDDSDLGCEYAPSRDLAIVYLTLRSVERKNS
jgi:hypothetical protein